MRSYTFIIVLLFSFASCSNKGLTTTQTSSSDDRKEIQQVLDLYVQSINTADTAIAAKVWEQSDNIPLINPVQHFKGWASVKNDFYVKGMKGFWKQRHLVTKDVSIRVYGNAAWADFLVDFNGTSAADNKEITLKNWRETHIYHRTTNGWRLVHEHYSPQTNPL
jgi:ketosteroid isomerase-like protein